MHYVPQSMEQWLELAQCGKFTMINAMQKMSIYNLAFFT